MIFENDHSQIAKVINIDRTLMLNCVVAQTAVLIQFAVVVVHFELVLKAVFSSGFLLVFDHVYRGVTK